MTRHETIVTRRPRRTSRRSTASTSTRRCAEQETPERQPRQSNRRRRRSRSTRPRASRRTAACTRRCTRSSRWRRSTRRPRHASRTAITAYERRARRVPRIPGEVQQGPRLRADRPLAGLGDARAADHGTDRLATRRCASSWSRRSCSAARCSCPKANSWAAPSRTCPLCTAATDIALRDRVLDVPQRTARKRVLRTARTARCSAAHRRRASAGAVREPDAADQQNGAVGTRCSLRVRRRRSRARSEPVTPVPTGVDAVGCRHRATYTAQCKHENGASWLQRGPSEGVSQPSRRTSRRTTSPRNDRARMGPAPRTT